MIQMQSPFLYLGLESNPGSPHLGRYLNHLRGHSGMYSWSASWFPSITAVWLKFITSAFGSTIQLFLRKANEGNRDHCSCSFIFSDGCALIMEYYLDKVKGRLCTYCCSISLWCVSWDVGSRIFSVKKKSSLICPRKQQQWRRAQRICHCCSAWWESRDSAVNNVMFQPPALLGQDELIAGDCSSAVWLLRDLGSCWVLAQFCLHFFFRRLQMFLNYASRRLPFFCCFVILRLSGHWLVSLKQRSHVLLQ